jgi:hypothetical protein
MKPPEYITDLSQLNRLPRMIVENHPRGYIGAFVEGGRRKGKTVFCMKTAHQVYQYKYGLNRDDAWKMVLDNMLFDLEDVDHLFDKLEGIDWEHLDPHWLDDKPIVKIWDDVSMHGGKYRYRVDSIIVDNLQRNIDIIGIAVTGFLMNAPELSNVLSFLRDYHDHKIIRIGENPDSGSDGYDRLAFWKSWRQESHGWHLRSDKPHTPFSCWLGDVDRWGLHEQWVYDKYESIRGKAIKRNRQIFRKMRDAAKKSEPNKSEEEILNEMNISPDELKEDAVC